MRRLIGLAAVPLLLAGCFEKEATYEESTARSPEMFAKSVLNPNTTYLYVPSTGAVPRYARSQNPFYQGEEKLVQVRFTENGMEVMELDKDAQLNDKGMIEPGRYVAEGEAGVENHPVLTIPGKHLGFQCDEDSFGECTNREEVIPKDQNNKDAWKGWQYFEPNYEDIQQHEVNYTNLWFEGGDLSLDKTDVISYEVNNGVIDIELEKTFSVSGGYGSYIKNGLSDLSFKTRFHYSLVDVNKLASAEYVPVYYADTEHDEFGFFKDEIQKNNVNGNCFSDCKKNYLLNRFNPEKPSLDYHLSGNFLLPKNEIFLKATEEAIAAINPMLTQSGVPPIKLIKPVSVESAPTSGDLRYSMINLIDDPLDNGLLGYGPSVSHPLTGETVQAHVNQYSGVARSGARYTWDGLVRVYNRGGISADLPVVVAPAFAAKASGNSQDVAIEAVKQSIAITKAELVEPVLAIDESRIAKFEAKQKELVQRISIPEDADELDQAMLREEQRLLDWGRQSAFSQQAIWVSSTAKSFIKGLDENDSRWNVGGKLKKWDQLTDDAQAEISDAVALYVYKTTLVHELGHNLGLRHNFKGSLDKENFYTEAESQKLNLQNIPAYSSVMDYAPSVLDELPIWGKYDLAAFRFGYKREIDLVADENNRNEIIEDSVFSLKGYDALYLAESRASDGNNSQDGTRKIPYGVVNYLDSYIDVQNSLESLNKDNEKRLADIANKEKTLKAETAIAEAGEISELNADAQLVYSGYANQSQFDAAQAALQSEGIVVAKIEEKITASNQQKIASQAAIVLLADNVVAAQSTLVVANGDASLAQQAYDAVLEAKNIAQADLDTFSVTLATSRIKLSDAVNTIASAALAIKDDTKVYQRAVIEAAEKTTVLASAEQARNTVYDEWTVLQNAYISAQANRDDAAIELAREKLDAKSVEYADSFKDLTAAKTEKLSADNILASASAALLSSQTILENAETSKAEAETEIAATNIAITEATTKNAKAIAAETEAQLGLATAIQSEKDQATSLLTTAQAAEIADKPGHEAAIINANITISAIELELAPAQTVFETVNAEFKRIQASYAAGRTLISDAQDVLNTAQTVQDKFAGDYAEHKAALELSIADFKAVGGDSIADESKIDVLNAYKFKNYEFCTDGNVILNSDCNRFDEGTDLSEITDYLIQRYIDGFETSNTRNGRVSFYEDSILSYASRRLNQQNQLRDIMEDYDRIVAGTDDDIPGYVGYCERELAKNPRDISDSFAKYCERIIAIDKAAPKTANFLLSLATMPDHTCELKGTDINGEAKYFTYSLSELFGSLNFRALPKGYISPLTCFDEGIETVLAKNNEVTRWINFNEMQVEGEYSTGFRPVEVVSETGRYLNGFNNNDPSYKYSNERAVLGTWVDRVFAVESLTRRVSYRPTSDEGTSALVDLPSAKVGFENFARHIAMGESLSNSIIFTDRNGDSITPQAEYQYDALAKISEPLDYWSTRLKGRLGIKSFGKTDITQALLSKVWYGANNVGDDTAGWAANARELVNMVSSRRYDEQNSQLDAKTIAYNGFVYQATPDNKIAYDIIENQRMSRELDELAAEGVDLQAILDQTSFTLPQYQNVALAHWKVYDRMGNRIAQDLFNILDYVNYFDDAAFVRSVIDNLITNGVITSDYSSWFASAEDEERFWAAMVQLEQADSTDLLLAIVNVSNSQWVAIQNAYDAADDNAKKVYDNYEWVVLSSHLNGSIRAQLENLPLLPTR